MRLKVRRGDYDGRAPHALLVELFTEHGMGMIVPIDAFVDEYMHATSKISLPPIFRTGFLISTTLSIRSNQFISAGIVRITEFVSRHYQVPADEARVIQKDLFPAMAYAMMRRKISHQKYIWISCMILT